VRSRDKVRCRNHDAEWTVDVLERPDGRIVLEDDGLACHGVKSNIGFTAACPIEALAAFRAVRWHRDNPKGNPPEDILAKAKLEAEYSFPWVGEGRDKATGSLANHFYIESWKRFKLELCTLDMVRER
jgi:hypothetical protein